MREIKFRAWDGEKMVSPDYIARGGAAYWKENSIRETSKAVMQYTGLKDKNGAEIYEGDILRNTNPKWRIQLPQFVMEWNSSRSGWCEYSPKCDFEVIGNVYENPELLEAE